ncbi:MAG TPA: type I pantothenate kinase [Aeromicrobium sp.]|nr:type I pantothenate kinase [Aeromicrobium sp.]
MSTMSEHHSPFVELDRATWARLANDVPQPLTAESIEKVRGLGDELDMDEVAQVYLPLSELISLHIRHAAKLWRSTEAFLGQPQPERTPFVIGIAGSVAVGKSTIARLLRELLAASPAHPRVQLVTTDGFLWPNDELKRRDILGRKGFPETYDRKALLRFVVDVKSGKDLVEAPTYSHLTYDRTDETVVVDRADILIVEGLNVLAPAKDRGDGSPGMAVSDYFDFSIYVDASPADIQQWYVERFLTLRKTAFADPASYFHRYSALTDEEARETAATLWETINGPNLRENIQSTRGRATLVLRKGPDHSVKWVRFRKI